ncbi:ABC transporter permease [Agrobacterium rhizogenes]|uniref:ABC transporter permease n=1 Tax=Rhizobium rhizogenes TaxID=359 RepID=UPI00115F40C2|nr:ABC transporter permease [Rhizobium rhizogenes]NTF52636.1 ABC transporter permease [Rhizobium rhizogenes]NTF65645.1 ABC transporter permease [Rhizobium rhizogenes]NTG04649.1 ABC transporter permease [Rhizobium rhizogenes]NTG11751.1 ABC transporter permease [Rhizobium rhizogenes]NTG18180.1 ABC transporter permease [Rhizobium rhizogenes]
MSNDLVVSPIQVTIARFVSRLVDLAPAIGLFVSIGFAWETAVKVFSIPAYLLPAPSAIGVKIWEARDMLAQNLAWTMAAAVLGFIIGTAFAVSLAILFLYSRAAERALFPWAITLKAIPILAIAPLFTIWLGFGLSPKVAIAAIACFFPTLVNTVKGLRTVDRQSLEFLSVIGATKAQTFRHARFYAALPYIFAAAKVSSSTAVIGAIVAEFTGANFGIGTVIVTAGYQQDAAMLFSAIVASSVATILMFYLVVVVEKISLFWPEASMDT